MIHSPIARSPFRPIALITGDHDGLNAPFAWLVIFCTLRFYFT